MSTSLFRRHSMSASLAASMVSADTRPPHVQAYPLLYSHRSVVNDFMLREAVNLLRYRGQSAVLTPIDEWKLDSAERSNASLEDGGGVLLFIGESNVEHVAGMLMTDDETFIFDATPFVEKRVTDVRCRFGYAGTSGDAPQVDDNSDNEVDDDVEQALRLARRAVGPSASRPPGTAGSATDERPATNNSTRAPGRSPDARQPSMPAGGAQPQQQQQQRYQYDSDRTRVYFLLKEYTGIGEDNEWVVQSLQLIGQNGPYGRVIFRAHLTSAAATRLRYSRAAALSAGGKDIDGALGEGGTGDAAATTRMPLEGEAYLKESNPELFAWAMLKDPIELEAAGRVIRNVIEYFRFSFTVMRTVKQLLTSIRKMQRFTRRMLAHRRSAELRMLRDWSAMEAEFKTRLQAHVSLPGDEVDRIVNRVLLKNCTTTVEYKRSVIRRLWEDRKQRYRRDRNDAQLTAVVTAAIDHMTQRFGWAIEPRELMAIHQARLVEQLSATGGGVFNHPRVQALFIDSIAESEIVKQAVAEARDLELRRINGRRLPVFGSTESRDGGPELSLDVNIPLSAPTVPPWDPSRYLDRPHGPHSVDSSSATTSDSEAGDAGGDEAAFSETMASARSATSRSTQGGVNASGVKAPRPPAVAQAMKTIPRRRP